MFKKKQVLKYTTESSAIGMLKKQFGFTPPECNIDTKNDGPWKMYLRLQTWRHFGYQFVRFQGGIRAAFQNVFPTVRCSSLGG